jgi:hypothetical protein
MFGEAGRQSNGDSPIITAAKHTVSILPLQPLVVVRRQEGQQVRVCLFSSISIILNQIIQSTILFPTTPSPISHLPKQLPTNNIPNYFSKTSSSGRLQLPQGKGLWR